MFAPPLIYTYLSNLLNSIYPLGLAITIPNMSCTKIASPSSNVVAGNTVTYTYVISHTAASNASAYNVAMTDVLASILTITSATMHGGPSAAFLTYTGLTVHYSAPSYLLSQSAVTITVVTSVSAVATLGTPPPIISFLSGGYTSAAIGGSAFVFANISLTVTMMQPSLAWAVYSTSLASTTNPYLAVGEIVTYRLTVTIPPGVSDLRVVATLPASVSQGYMGATSASIISVSGNSLILLGLLGTSGTLVDTSVPADGIIGHRDMGPPGLGIVIIPPDPFVIVFQMTAVVNNVAANVAGLSLVPTTYLRYGLLILYQIHYHRWTQPNHRRTFLWYSLAGCQRNHR